MTEQSVAPLTIEQAERRLAAALGHPVTVRRDVHGYYAGDGNGGWLPFYNDWKDIDGKQTVVLVPINGSWPDCPPMCACDDLMDCPTCHGEGHIHTLPIVRPEFADKCPDCNGAGQVVDLMDCPANEQA